MATTHRSSRSSSRSKRSGTSSRSRSSARKSSGSHRSSARSSRSRSASSKRSGSSSGSSRKRKYSPKAQESVKTEMHQFKRGKLKSGSGRKVKSRKQAIAIGLSEARRSGAKVPPPKGRKKAA